MPLPMTGNPPVWHAHPLQATTHPAAPPPLPCSTAATSQAVLAHSFNMLVSHLARHKIANRMVGEGGEKEEKTERKLRAKWFSYFGISASYAYTSSTCTSWYFHLFISQINEASSAHFHGTFHIVIYYYCPPPSPPSPTLLGFPTIFTSVAK